jgi:hypothetical protein
VPWIAITGLAPAAINSLSAETSSLNLTTGRAGDTVDVLATGAPTYLSSGGGSDTVNVGSDGSLQGILGPLYIENPPAYTTLNIDDSADTATHVAYLSTITPGIDPVPWGSITGLAPAPINFEWADVNSPVNITTHPGTVTWDVNPNAWFNTDGYLGGVWVEVMDNGIIINWPVIPR